MKRSSNSGSFLKPDGSITLTSKGVDCDSGHGANQDDSQEADVSFEACYPVARTSGGQDCLEVATVFGEPLQDPVPMNG